LLLLHSKAIPACQRHDILVNTGRIGVLVSYTTTTKQPSVYSPELGYTFRSSKVLVDEKVTGRLIDLVLRNCESGPQGRQNIMPDRKLQRWPRKEVNEITQLASVSPTLTL
jgi:hypothetical protein